MIRVGLAGWGDHDDLYVKGTPARDKLKVYSKQFPVVEVDSSFYAVQKADLYQRWAAETTDDFSFLIKAYQGMTGHLRGANPFPDTDSMFQAFKDSIEPVREAGKLKAVLFQYPPWFECDRNNVALLRAAKDRMGDIPVALEFRHQSWFAPDMMDKTLSFMQQEGWIHSICDEPQVEPGSVPTVLRPTDKQLTVVRFHGRNASGWSSGGSSNWREVRYLYRYNREELQEWRDNLRMLERDTEEICVIFNNNSGGDAAENAVEFMKLLDLEPGELAPKQLDLFE